MLSKLVRGYFNVARMCFFFLPVEGAGVLMKRRRFWESVGASTAI